MEYLRKALGSLAEAERQKEVTRDELDRLAYVTWLDHQRSWKHAAWQLGISPSTVKRRAERHMARNWTGTE
jgi:hypothetical protein